MLLAAGGFVGAVGASSNAVAELSEIDGFDQALASGTADAARKFVEAFPSSHLVNDLFELLPPDIAAEACAGLPDGVSRAARRACEKLEASLALAPAAGSPAARPQGVGSTPAGEAASDGAISDQPTVQPAPDRAVARTGAASNNGPGDKKSWVVATAAADTSTDATPSSRRDGVAADDTAGDATEGTTDGTADTTDTNDTATDEASPVAGSNREDSGSLTAGPGGNGSDGGMGGSTDGGGEVGGGTH